MKKRVKIIITIAVIILCYYLYVKKDSPSTANFSSSSEITMSNAKFVLDQNYTLTADKQSVNSERTQVTFINPKLVSQNYTLQSNNGIYSKTDSSINLMRVAVSQHTKTLRRYSWKVASSLKQVVLKLMEQMLRIIVRHNY
ncbi:MAG: hypothetical protein NTX05_06895 [Fusobacteria bacterium]|nr:hypothetical protein [Fusobacteriota bacterium]